METGRTGASESAGSPGVALRAARTAQNLSLGEVARNLRLSVRQVEALEAGAFERLPGPVFVRGFIRNYARLLKLDSEPLMLHLAPVQTGEPDALAMQSTHAEPLSTARARWQWYVVAVIALVLVLAAYEIFLMEPADAGRAQPPAAVPVTATPRSKDLPSPPEPASTAAVANVIPTQGTAETPVAPPPDSGAPDSIASPAGESEIRLNFEDDSWVEIRDHSGRTIYSQLNRRGTESQVKGRPPFVVVVGNARGVRLTYNDRAVDLAPYVRYDVARLTLK